MDDLINIHDLSVKYSDTPVLTDVNISIGYRDFAGVIGPNGGGKTTLIKAILGLIPYKGSIHFNDNLDKDKSLIGYLPQQNNFDTSFPITVTDIILSGLQNKRYASHRVMSHSVERIKELTSLTGISGLEKRSVGEISGGQLQRVLLCRALISDPKLLILDEPATFVDNKFERDLYEILRQLNDRMAIVMVSHDLGTITSYVKSIICVNKNVHKHNTGELTTEMLENYSCPIQVISHGDIPHTVLKSH